MVRLCIVLGTRLYGHWMSCDLFYGGSCFDAFWWAITIGATRSLAKIPQNYPNFTECVGLTVSRPTRRSWAWKLPH